MGWNEVSNLVAVDQRAELMTHVLYLLPAEQGRFADGAGLQVNASEGFHLHRSSASALSRLGATTLPCCTIRHARRPSRACKTRRRVMGAEGGIGRSECRARPPRRSCRGRSGCRGRGRPGRWHESSGSAAPPAPPADWQVRRHAGVIPTTAASAGGPAHEPPAA